MSGTRKKIAILGGGVGAMTAAFELSRPGWQQRYESITVYQLGWRLGGKGASGRGYGGRIEEHGLHIWLGYYENAFRMLARCYEELNRPSQVPLATIDAAFERASHFGVVESQGGEWKPWVARFPETETNPWDATARGVPLVEALVGMVGLLRRFLLSVRPLPSFTRSAVWHSPGAAAVGLGAMTVRALADGGRRLALLSTTVALRTLQALDEDALRHTDRSHETVSRLLDQVSSLVHRGWRDQMALSDVLRREWYLIDILLACSRGIVRSGALTAPEGLDVLDDHDFSEWLMENGADEESARCALVRAIVYDLAFAYRHGDETQPRCSAAVALRGLFRFFFTYKGAIAWKMRAGMGDTVFAPMYQALVQRGVEFKFFHRVDALHVAPGGDSISAIDIGVQANARDGSYDPLIDVKGLPSWPAAPLFDQLEDGEEIRSGDHDLESFWCDRPDHSKVRLEVGRDFDVVVLGISLGALPFICSELVERSPRWQAMVDHLETTCTQAFQLWLSAPMGELSGHHDWAQLLLGGFVEPFDTCADMSQVIEREALPSTVRTAVYFCNVLDMPGPIDRDDASATGDASRRVRENAIRFLRNDVLHVWPGAVRRYPNDFRWELLVGASDGLEGEERFDSQYWRANVNPSDRYVLSLPGTSKYRLDPDDSGFRNLFLAGDWTRCVINAGCVEGAVISGMLAAKGIQGVPREDEIVGYGRGF